jgi:hypothetical protein
MISFIYRQGDQKFSIHLMITIQKVTNYNLLVSRPPGPGGHYTHTNAICYP